MFWRATDRASLLNYRSSKSDLKRLCYEEITKCKSLLSLGIGMNFARLKHDAKMESRPCQTPDTECPEERETPIRSVDNHVARERRLWESAA